MLVGNRDGREYSAELSPGGRHVAYSWDPSGYEEAMGRQIDSRERPVRVPALNRDNFPGIFIRAPRILSAAEKVTIHARAGDDPVFVQFDRMIATTFHPELTGDPVFHDFFLKL